MNKWKYGNSWEKYPIKEKEIWKYKDSLITVNNIFNTLPDFIYKADIIYTDPPWSLGNINSFYTKAGRRDYINDYELFCCKLFSYIAKIKARCTFLEIGKQNKNLFIEKMKQIYSNITCWNITYNRKNTSYIIRGGSNKPKYCLNGIDDLYTPYKVIEYEKPFSVLDLCTGRGLTGIASYKAGVIFYGIELNKRRLAVMIDKLGGIYERIS